MNSPCPWQLYLFALVNLGGGISILGLLWDPCSLLTGDSPCNSAERVTSVFWSVGFLYVGVLFYILTYLNKENAPKLKRLNMFAANCTAALFAGTIFTGSIRLGGFERSLFHIGDMLFIFALFVILVSAMDDVSPVAASTSPLTGLGVNPKSLLLLVAIACLIKLFACTDLLSYSYFLKDPDEFTDLARLFWNWTALQIFEILVAVLFALAYGDSKDQEAVTLAIVGMMIVSIAAMLPVLGYLKDGLLLQGCISAAIFIALSVVAVVGGRKQQRNGYEPVASMTV
jgi:hypothetical protein